MKHFHFFSERALIDVSKGRVVGVGKSSGGIFFPRLLLESCYHRCLKTFSNENK
jgi:hypothetical protein